MVWEGKKPVRSEVVKGVSKKRALKRPNGLTTRRNAIKPLIKPEAPSRVFAANNPRQSGLVVLANSHHKEPQNLFLKLGKRLLRIDP